MGIPNLSGSVFSVIVRTAEYLFNRKSQQRRAGEAASQLVSVLDRFVVDCDAVVTDDGYPPFTNPEYHDYRERTPQCETVRLAVPDIPNRELLPLSISDRVRAIESLQNDTPRALMEAHEDDDGSGDGFYATRQKIFSLLGFKAVELSRELRSAYRLSPPSFEHRDREKRIEEKLRYHDGFSVKIRRIEQRIARKAKMAAGKITQEKKRDFKDEV
ncbi:hypothetical protein EY875_23830 [Salmonella enterica subsp. enterica serovar Senftenberg]|uniref:hypothetical protein n=1 Tax=Cronobacter sakazakii TaxID=28141 RepID=UPI000CF0E106|nr:hypothetical protein [Cronobacter sakazakii]EAY8053611.1 hypothetical protein [Salmonella enterica]ECB5623716.1 hypothetical protein [Salmonella enterica subsp. enterica serovar Senftenberg]HCT7767166.1 hypothetical protein [Klebsiella pneumoniae]EBP9204217.1 hypothetical protein [Salmonella enterica]EDG9646620.1 hypothetical protein [Salmonella enterica subsp. enterica serovar Senftenberg]